MHFKYSKMDPQVKPIGVYILTKRNVVINYVFQLGINATEARFKRIVQELPLL